MLFPEQEYLGHWVSSRESESSPAGAGPRKRTDCIITRMAVRDIDPKGGYDIRIENDLPVGQGFGMSAAGAIAASLCVCEYLGKDYEQAFAAAHRADIAGGGGYGDVSGIMGRSNVPIRSVAGLPPFGKVINSGLKMDISVAILGGPLDTGDTLSDDATVSKIQDVGSRLVTEFIEKPSLESLFAFSKEFSESIGLETPEITRALSDLRKEGNAGMCMLGHSIYTDLSPARTRKILGDGVTVFSCRSTDSMPKIIRKA